MQQKKKGSQTEEEKSVFVEKVESCFLILAFDVPPPFFFFNISKRKRKSAAVAAFSRFAITIKKKADWFSV